MATRLTQSMTSGGSTTKFTKSIWVKRTGLTQGYVIDSQDDEVAIQFRDDHKLNVFIYSPSSYSTNLVSNQLFRDTNAWYHIVYAVDYTNATQAHRARVYVNGEEITSWSTETRPGNNTTTFNTFNSSITHYIGNNAAANKPFDGLMSHVIHVDGTQYAPTEFGETDSTTGEWKIKTAPSVTWGTKGYWVLKDGNSVTDASPNTNNWTVGGGTLTKTEDCPSNVFATLNALQKMGNSSFNLTNGNTRFQTTSTSWGNRFSTLAFQSGKFYAEAKVLALNSSQGYAGLGIGDVNDAWYNGDDTLIKQKAASAGTTLDHRSGQSDVRSGASSITSGVGDFSANDIIGLAVDMDNKALYIHKNGTYITIGGVTGVPTSGASKTGAITIPTSVNDCAFVISGYSTDADLCYNFGNGYFLTTAVSSAGTNASGNGIFEHDCPAGFTALSTKGLNL